MPLQGSGTISLANLQSVLGGANPISMSEYYRGGSYVTDASGPVTEGPFYSRTTAPRYYYANLVGGGTTIFWNETQIYSSTTSGSTYFNSYTVGGITYTRGAFVETVGGYRTPEYDFSRVSRTSPASGNPNNSNVPQNGTLSLTQFYGVE